ncbi:MAG: hypothetical protein ACI9EW_001731 [Cellvibrionaceae bacterium]|jgi:hypothetical protein
MDYASNFTDEAYNKCLPYRSMQFRVTFQTCECLAQLIYIQAVILALSNSLGFKSDGIK